MREAGKKYKMLFSQLLSIPEFWCGRYWGRFGTPGASDDVAMCQTNKQTRSKKGFVCLKIRIRWHPCTMRSVGELKEQHKNWQKNEQKGIERQKNQANSIRKAKEPSEEYKKGKIWPPNFLLPTTCTKYTWPGARPPVRRVLLGVKTCFTQNLNVLAHILVM